MCGCAWVALVYRQGPLLLLGGGSRLVTIEVVARDGGRLLLGFRVESFGLTDLVEFAVL